MMRAALAGCCLLLLGGCYSGDWPTTPSAPADFPIPGPGDPNAVEVKSARLRSTPGGCEVDVTFTNVSAKSVSAGFAYDILDAAGRTVASRSTGVQSVIPGETATVSSEGTAAGPSRVPCPEGGRPRLTRVSVFNF